jgi:hypothetical protein
MPRLEGKLISPDVRCLNKIVKNWNKKEKPQLNICPERYCFCWVPPGGKADISGKVYDSFEEAVEASNNGVTFLKGGCAAPFGPCRRETKKSEDDDCYEPFESVLNKDGLPQLFFCDPENLIDECVDEYNSMAKKLWGST